MTEIIGCKLTLEAVFRLFPVRHRGDPGVQNQDVGAALLARPIGSEFSNRGQTSGVEQPELHVRAGMLSPDRRIASAPLFSLREAMITRAPALASASAAS